MKRRMATLSPSPPSKRRHTRGAALLAAAAAGGESSAAAVIQTSRNKRTITKGDAVITAASAVAGVEQKEQSRPTKTAEVWSNMAASAIAAPSSSRRAVKSTSKQQRGATPTAVSRGTTESSSSSSERAGASATVASAAAATNTPCSPPLSTVGARASSNKGSTADGGRSGRSRGGLADSDEAIQVLATLLSPVSTASEDARPEARDDQGGWRSARDAHEIGNSRGGDGGGGGNGEKTDHDPCPLETMFLALEQVLPLFRRRRQAPLFKQVRPAVEGMCGRSFTRRHLAQIVFVQPDAYKLSSKTDARPTRGVYRLRDLLIETGPNPPPLDEDGGCADVPGAEGGGGEKGSGDGKGANTGPRSRCSGSDGDGRSNGGGEAVSARRREAFLRLLAAARARHCKRGGGDGGDGPSAIDECSLPEAPLPDTSPLPADGMNGGSLLTPDTGGIESTSTGVSPSVGQGEGKSPADWRSDSGLLGPYGGGGGVSEPGGRVDYGVEGSEAPKDVEALRERLRKKDALSAKERNKSVEQKEADRRRKGNLPAMADAVRSFFAHSGRATCSLDALVEALSNSSKHALSQKEARDRVRMIASIVPEWCTIVAPPAPSVGGRSGGGCGVESGMVARPMKAKDVVRVNARIRFDEVRQMIVFMASGSGGGTSQ